LRRQKNWSFFPSPFQFHFFATNSFILLTCFFPFVFLVIWLISHLALFLSTSNCLSTFWFLLLFNFSVFSACLFRIPFLLLMFEVLCSRCFLYLHILLFTKRSFISFQLYVCFFKFHISSLNLFSHVIFIGYLFAYFLQAVIVNIAY
jgi:hypothetical protein